MIQDFIKFTRVLGFSFDIRLWLAIAGSILASALIFPVGFLIQHIFDEAIPHSDIRLLLKLSGVAISLTGLSAFFVVIMRNSILSITKEVTYKIRTTLAQRLLYTSHQFHLNSDLSRVLKVAVYNTEKMDTLFNAFFSTLIPSALVSLLLVLILFFLDWTMGVSLLALGAVSVWVIGNLRAASKKHVTQFQDVFQVFHTSMHFMLEFNKLIKTSASQEFELSAYKDVIRKVNFYNLRMIDGFTRMANYQDLIFSVVSIFLLALGGYRVMEGAMTLGLLLYFYFCLYLLKKYATNISLGFPLVLEGAHALVEYEDLMNTTDTEPYLSNRTHEFKGSIDIDHISFGFSQHKLFDNFCLQLRPGKITLLQGPNGSGKSTLVNLILGLYQPDDGTLLADGIPYSDISIAYLRSQITIVFQENALFNGSILDNLRYGRREASLEEVCEAIRMATLKDFVNGLPDGLNTEVGEHGMKLSGGQRQKIALARCFLRKSPLIIMDEPTNHLDQDTMVEVIGTLKNMDHRPAILLVSHDTRLIRLADQIQNL